MIRVLRAWSVLSRDGFITPIERRRDAYSSVMICDESALRMLKKRTRDLSSKGREDQVAIF